MGKISRKEKFCYGLGDLSSNIVFSAISFYLLYFLVKVAGLNTTWAGIVFIVARLWDAISDYLMGIISDKTKSKYGKRRVYMIFGSLPYGLIFILLWLVPFGPETAQFYKFLYYCFAYLLFNTVWTVVYVPYNSLTANMTSDYDERTSLNGIRIIMANIGILLGAAVFALLADGNESILYGLFNSEKTSYLVASAIFGILSFVIMLISALNVKERVDTSEPNNYGLFKTLKQFFKLKEFRYTSIYYLLSMIGFDIIMSIFIFYVNDALKFAGGSEAMLFVAIPLVSAIITAPLWVKLSSIFEKYKVYAGAAIYLAIVLFFAIFVKEHNYTELIILTVLVGIGMSAIQILPFASIPDVIEIDEYHNNVRREGAYYGIVQFMYKLASGLSIGIVSFILGLFGYKEAIGNEIIVQPNQALMAIRIILGILPGLIFVISIFFGVKANINRKRFNEIKLEIEKRRLNNKQ